MSQEQYATYVEDMDDRARREVALAFFMGWLEGYTEAGVSVGGDEIEEARSRIEAKFNINLLAFGQSGERSEG